MKSKKTASSSSPSPPRDGASRNCRRHERAVEMRDAIVKVRFPYGTLPVQGLRCPRCGEEEVPGDEAQRAFDEARRLGLFGPEKSKRRKVTRIGTSVGVTLDRELLRELGVEPGSDVDVGLQGDAIVIRRAEART